MLGIKTKGDPRYVGVLTVQGAPGTPDDGSNSICYQEVVSVKIYALSRLVTSVYDYQSSFRFNFQVASKWVFLTLQSPLIPKYTIRKQKSLPVLLCYSMFNTFFMKTEDNLCYRSKCFSFARLSDVEILLYVYYMLQDI